MNQLFQETNQDQKQSDINANIVSVITDRCSCDFTSKNIVESLFSCRSSETKVVYKASIQFNTSQPGHLSADKLTSLVSSWVSDGPSLTVNGILLNVDPTCPVELESLTSDDCITRLQTNELPNLESGSTVIIGSSVAVGALITVTTLTIVVATILIICFRMKKKRATPDLQM